mgnify:FL=1
MRSTLRLVLMLAVLLVWALPARAQFQLIRDAEIEATIGDLAAPVFSAGGVNPSSVSIYLVGDDRLNAFVAGGQNLFLFTGLLMRAATPEQLAGVIAHETGHIAGGHLVRLADAQKNASVEALLSTLLGAAAAAAGAPQVGGAIIAGGATMAQQSFLSFSRSQEQSADQAAVGYLDRTGIGAAGLLEFFEILDQQRLLTGARVSPYLQTHPLTRDRISFVERHVERSGAGSDIGPDMRERHARMVAKLEGFLERPSRVLESYAGREDVAGRYARAIATYRLNDVEGALRQVETLLAEEPQNPYFHELKGQILFESGRVDEAVAPYATAARLAPEAAPIRLGHGRALLQAGRAEAAIAPLEFVVRAEPRNAFAWRTLGIAHGRAGDLASSNLALAEAALLDRRLDDAGLFLARADDMVAAGPERRRLQDLERALDQARDER